MVLNVLIPGAIVEGTLTVLVQIENEMLYALEETCGSIAWQRSIIQQ